MITGIGRCAISFAQEADAVHARHLDVERDDVGLEPQDHVAGDERIAGAADDLDVGLAR